MTRKLSNTKSTDQRSRRRKLLIVDAIVTFELYFHNRLMKMIIKKSFEQ